MLDGSISVVAAIMSQVAQAYPGETAEVVAQVARLWMIDLDVAKDMKV